MKFKDYVEKMNQFLKENPEAGEMAAVYSCDVEGNDYSECDYSPTLMCLYDGEVYDLDQEDVEANSVCVN